MPPPKASKAEVRWAIVTSWQRIGCTQKTVVEKWCKQQSTTVSVLAQWPPNSPDLNLIENVWSLVQRKVDALGCKTFEEFKVAVISEVQAVPLKVLRSLFNSMPKRVKEVIKLGGKKTKY